MKSHDSLIRSKLKALSSQDSTYWEFRRQAARDGVHSLLQYPAMMVPQMQHDVLKLLLDARPEAMRILDPFVGSGTVMTESMLAGRHFTGIDINPLAILTCIAKTHVHKHKKFSEISERLIAKVLASRMRRVDVDFFGRDKWFTAKALNGLSKIRRAIIEEEEYWARTILWTVLAETVRQTSNSRTSTYKLHIRPESEIPALPDPIEVFILRTRAACAQLRFHSEQLRTNEIAVRRPTLYCESAINLPQLTRGKFDLIVTSPPYGDNHSTVPYGQFSYLALCWIHPNDLPGELLIENTRSIDTKSLGGRAVIDLNASYEVRAASPTFDKFMSELAQQKRFDLEIKVMAFTIDFFESIKSTVSKMDNNAYAAWTLGNRTVGGIVVPLTKICRELHEACGARHIETVRRRIPNKRTPVRNCISDTMSSECLLLLGT